MTPLAVIGAGYVGLATAVALIYQGNRVRVSESDPQRLAGLLAGIIPFEEPGLPRLVAYGLKTNRLTFHATTDQAVADAGAVFLALPTPEGPGGAADLSIVEAALRAVGPMVDPPIPLVIRSSVPPGSTPRFRALLDDLGCWSPLVICPEFLEEGHLVENALHPSRVIIGTDDTAARLLVASLFSPLETPIIYTNPAAAELIKYASNSYLATRITFVNMVARLSDAVGADIDAVLSGIGLDPRIGNCYLRPGPGYGGSCFPKDVPALVAAAAEQGIDLKLLRAVIETNADQLDWIVGMITEAASGLTGATIGLLGLAFKGGTSDTRRSPAVALAERLTASGARVRAYDPAARVDLPGVEIAADPLAAAAGADVLAVATDWPEFAALDLVAVAAAMRGRAVIDARNLLDPAAAGRAGLIYRRLGR